MCTVYIIWENDNFMIGIREKKKKLNTIDLAKSIIDDYSNMDY